MIQVFLNKYFYDYDNLIFPKKNFLINHNDEINIIDVNFKGNNYNNEKKILIQKIRDLGTNIPPMIKAYMELSSTMKYFGTSVNSKFGSVEESGIMVTINDIHDSKKKRYFVSYINNKGNFKN